MEENSSVHQVNHVSRITGEGRAEFQGRGGMGLNKREAGGGRNTSTCARKQKILEGDKSDGCSSNTSLYVYHLPCIVYYSRRRFDVIAS